MRHSHRDARMQPSMLLSALCGIAFVLSLLSGFPQASQAAEDISGQLAFNNACRTCHIMREGDNRLGPSLYDVIGREAQLGEL